jgi:mRNA interferase MazF
MTDYSFGAVILVPFPFTDQTTTKKRPAVVVSSTEYNAERPDIVLLAITSQIRPIPAFGEVFVSNWQEAGLIKPSAIKPVFATIEKTLVLKQLGLLAEEDKKALRDTLQTIIG